MFAGAFARADRAIMRALGEDGPVTYTAGVVGAEPISAPGIFDAAYSLTDAGHTGVTSSTPAVFFLLADLPVDPQTDNWKLARVHIGSTAYRIKEARPDGKGGVVLALGEA